MLALCQYPESEVRLRDPPSTGGGVGEGDRASGICHRHPHPSPPPSKGEGIVRTVHATWRTRTVTCCPGSPSDNGSSRSCSRNVAEAIRLISARKATRPERRH